ncbi:MAG: hypothetical protein KIT56_00335 [Gammaproteobacteria bacterium]|nr:hypothetical protein [Gammaproteobacteria bacterium]MCW5582333.1 hypothetical protein [Gammaproteobacteria bacterium]
MQNRVIEEMYNHFSATTQANAGNNIIEFVDLYQFIVGCCLSSTTINFTLVLAFGAACFSLGYYVGANKPLLPAIELPEYDDDESSEEIDDAINPAQPYPELVSVPEEVQENEYEQRLRKAGFTGKIPHEFIDPISQSIMVRPVILLTSDHTSVQSYEEDSVLALFKHEHNPLCPITRKPVSEYVLNRDFKNVIQKWVEDVERKMQEKPLSELPREISKKRLLEFQGLFHTRRPCKPYKEEELKRYEYKSLTV